MLLISLFIALFSLPIMAETFQAPVTNTQWEVMESPLECSLSQPIGGFGHARFYQHSGTSLSLSFNTTQLPADGTDILYAVAPAPWQNSDDLIELARQPSDPGQTQFELHGIPASTAFTYLQEGHFPIIHYQSNHFNHPINVALSTVKLNDSLSAFQACLQQLHTDGFQAVEHLTIYFDIEDATLDKLSKNALDRLVAYIKVDDRINQIDISSHTDSFGPSSLNKSLSMARANAVKTYLASQNIAENKMTIHSLIDKKPVTTNETLLGRAQNRRTEITLIR